MPGLSSVWTLGQGSMLRGWSATGMTLQGGGHSTKHARIHRMVLLVMGLILGDPASSRDLGLVILMGPFQLEVFHDSTF